MVHNPLRTQESMFWCVEIYLFLILGRGSLVRICIAFVKVCSLCLPSVPFFVELVPFRVNLSYFQCLHNLKILLVIIL